VTTAATTYVEARALQTLDAVESTVIYSTEPLWGTAFAVMYLGEMVGPNTILGAILIITACLYRTIPIETLIATAAASQLTALEGLEEFADNFSVNIEQTLINLFGDNSL
jgi:hypothetical protein